MMCIVVLEVHDSDCDWDWVPETVGTVLERAVQGQS